MLSSRPARPSLGPPWPLSIFWAFFGGPCWSSKMVSRKTPKHTKTNPFLLFFARGLATQNPSSWCKSECHCSGAAFFATLKAPNVVKKRHFFAFHSGFFLKICRLIVKHGVLLVDFQQNCENKVFLSTAVRVQNTFSCSAGVLFFEFVVQQKQQLIAA